MAPTKGVSSCQTKVSCSSDGKICTRKITATYTMNDGKTMVATHISSMEM
jgi:hypothetical protein